MLRPAENRCFWSFERWMVLQFLAESFGLQKWQNFTAKFVVRFAENELAVVKIGDF